MNNAVVVIEHRGWPERKLASAIPGLHRLPQQDGTPISVVALENGEIHAVESSAVYTPEGLRYAEEWATKTHTVPSQVYIPRTLEVTA